MSGYWSGAVAAWKWHAQAKRDARARHAAERTRRRCIRLLCRVVDLYPVREARDEYVMTMLGHALGSMARDWPDERSGYRAEVVGFDEAATIDPNWSTGHISRVEWAAFKPRPRFGVYRDGVLVTGRLNTLPAEIQESK